MKKIISLTLAAIGLYVTATGMVGAYYVQPAASSYFYTYDNVNNNPAYNQYYNNYVNAPTSNSYTYTQGCYIYQYDAFTRVTSLIGSNCQTNISPSYSTSPTYQTYYTQPTYTYTYTQPTYQYTTYPSQRKYHHTNYIENGNSSYNYTCSWYNGSQVCY